MGYRNILLAVNLAVDPVYLLQRAGKFAQRCDARLHLISVVPAEERLADAPLEARLARLKSESFDYLRSLSVELPCRLGVCEVVCGDPIREIELASRQLNADLVIAGHRQSRSLLARLRDQTAERLLGEGRYDLLILDESGSFWRPPLRLVVCVGLADEGEPLLLRASQLSQALGAQLHLLHVVEPVAVAHSGLELEYDPTGWLVDHQQLAEQQLARWAAGLPQPLASVRVLMGSVSRLVAAEAADPRVALVILGRHRKGERRLLGSHVHAILRQGGGDMLVMCHSASE